MPSLAKLHCRFVFSATLLIATNAVCLAEVNKAVVDAGKKATALVEIYSGKQLTGWASAFCIDRSGIFITNSHVANSGVKDNKLTLVIDAGSHTQAA